MTFNHATVSVQAEHTFFFRDTTDAVFGNFPAFATQIFAAVVAQLVPKAWGEVIYNGIVLEDIRNVPYGGGAFPQTPTTGTKGAAAAGLPTNAAFALKKITASIGRSGRGRLYYPMWHGTDQVSPDLTSAARADELKNAFAAFQTAVEGGALPCEIGIVSFQNNKVPVNPGTFERITSWSYADLNLDSQRRRLVGRGR